MTQAFHWRLLPPLRDPQEDPPVLLCPLCGEEQYRWDRLFAWGGQQICFRCQSRLEQEEDKDNYDPARTFRGVPGPCPGT